MARLIHPSYYPAERTAPYCSYWGSGSALAEYSLPLSTGMEAYWRVRKWQVSANLSYFGETAGVSGTLNLSSPDSGSPATSEIDLVCPEFRSVQLSTSGTTFNGTFSVNAVGFEWEFTAFEFLEFNWPARKSFSEGIIFFIPITFTMGDTTMTINASVVNQEDVTGSGSVTAIEWWPYADEDGKALYSTSTGQRL